MTQGVLVEAPGNLRYRSSGRGAPVVQTPARSNTLTSRGSGGRVQQFAAGQKEAGRRWRHLLARPHPWRKQLWLRARKMTVGQLVATIEANRLTAEQAAANFDLPPEAVEEALAYYRENTSLIKGEAEAERQWLI